MSDSDGEVADYGSGEEMDYEYDDDEGSDEDYGADFASIEVVNTRKVSPRPRPCCVPAVPRQGGA